MANEPDEEIQADAEAVDVSEELAGGEESVSEVSLPPTPLGPPKPRSTIFTLLLIISFIFIGLAIYLVAHELNQFYEVTFGGMLSPPTKVSQTETPGTEK